MSVDSHLIDRPSIDALETFVELLARVEADGSTDDFYSRLCEATCRVASMDRAVIFRYDDARRRAVTDRQLQREADQLVRARLDTAQIEQFDNQDVVPE